MNTASANLNVNPRQLLLEELERRCQTNPRYSLRAFAKALNLSPSALSMILRGERGLSKNLASQVSKKLGLDPQMSESFIRNALKRKKSINPESYKFNQLSLDRFAVISEWYHFAILSLIETKDFKPVIAWISTRLEISLAEARAGVERLVRLNLLDTTKEKWKQIGDPIFLDNDKSTAATRRFQSQVLERAIFSLENDPMELRELNSVTIAIDPRQVDYAKKKIKDFLIELMNELEAKGPRREVYHLSTQLYPVSKNRGN